ncbi:hypothetical protein B0F90DRAFT_1724453 [Multifurca ochricompacta]|uniref:Uncharacterized protein n=1 Tax=Multifurca ochricompacta TaxID=376703 RepID=A0AAD4LT54_9AGAM|nr:hypothetical protein B0F90DRAFT_1794419 [Multifurca ochricompacta]KAI0300066.1 hypothetical protein B0F90DRAFT_1724453 [Multifurca ochricompacta]
MHHHNLAQFLESHMGYSLYYFAADFCMEEGATVKITDCQLGHAAMVSVALLDVGIHHSRETDVFALALEPPVWGCLVWGLLASMIQGTLCSPNLWSLLDYHEGDFTDSLSLASGLLVPMTLLEHIKMMLPQLTAVFASSNWENPALYANAIKAEACKHALDAICTEVEAGLLAQDACTIKQSCSADTDCVISV